MIYSFLSDIASKFHKQLHSKKHIEIKPSCCVQKLGTAAIYQKSTLWNLLKIHVKTKPLL